MLPTKVDNQSKVRVKNEKAKTISSDYLPNCIKTATAKKQIPIASFIPIYTDVAAAKSNERFMPFKQRCA
uniref:hypothetical protein n=1 Tax=Roseivirga sp. TaxID=1964215 RepID=UPI00404845E0